MCAVKTNQELSAKVDFVLVGLKRSVVAQSLTGRGNHTALKLANTSLHVANSISRSIHCVILEETVKLCDAAIGTDAGMWSRKTCHWANLRAHMSAAADMCMW